MSIMINDLSEYQMNKSLKGENKYSEVIFPDCLMTVLQWSPKAAPNKAYLGSLLHRTQGVPAGSD